jgi:hypothetical protein
VGRKDCIGAFVSQAPSLQGMRWRHIRNTAYAACASRYGYALDVGEKVGIVRKPLTMGIPSAMRSSRAGSALVLLPMALAVLGAAFDERRNLGFSTWRSACRSAGFSIPSLFSFTLELLPSAVMGALLGGAALQIVGIGMRHRKGMAAASLAAHGGCSLGMLAGLPLCVLPVPVPWLLGAEILLAALAAGLLHRFLAGRPSCGASGSLRTRSLPSA